MLIAIYTYTFTRSHWCHLCLKLWSVFFLLLKEVGCFSAKTMASLTHWPLSPRRPVNSKSSHYDKAPGLLWWCHGVSAGLSVSFLFFWLWKHTLYILLLISLVSNFFLTYIIALVWETEIADLSIFSCALFVKEAPERLKTFPNLSPHPAFLTAGGGHAERPESGCMGGCCTGPALN